MSINDQYRRINPKPAQWAAFIREWWGYCKNMPIRVNHLYTRVASACPGFEFGHIDNKHGKLSLFGSLMALQLNQEIAGFKVLPGPYRTTSFILTPGDSARVYSDGREFVKQLTDEGYEALMAAAQALAADGRLARVEPPEEPGTSVHTATPIFVLDGKPLPIFAPEPVPIDPALWMTTPQLQAHFDRLEAFERGEIVIDGLRKCACQCGEFIPERNAYRYRWRQGHQSRYKGDLLALSDIGDDDARTELVRRGWYTERELIIRHADHRLSAKSYVSSRLRQRVHRAKRRLELQQRRSIGVMYDELVEALKAKDRE